MVLPTDRRRSPEPRSTGPTRLTQNRRDEYELYERDGQFVLSIEMPGFEPEDISVNWEERTLHVSAEHEDDRASRQRTYQQSFRVSKDVEDDEIQARYERGILDVYLPIEAEAETKGKSIPVES